MIIKSRMTHKETFKHYIVEAEFNKGTIRKDVSI
jgi:hypothetical protein